MLRCGLVSLTVLVLLFPDLLLAVGKKERSSLPADGWVISGAKDPTDEAAWVEHQGEKCIVKTTASAEAAKQIAEYTDQYLTEFRKIFNAELKIKEPLTIRVFAHDKEYWVYYKHEHGEPDRLPPALYYGKIKETWILLQGKGDRKSYPVETAKHEYTHHMLHFLVGEGGELPTWFNEGSACFFEFWDIYDTRKRNVKENLERATKNGYGSLPLLVKEAWGTPKFPTVERLVNLSHHEFHEGGGLQEHIHYATSWSLVSYLTTSKKGKQFFSLLLQSIVEGKDMNALLTPGNIAYIQKGWHKDIERRLIPWVKKQQKKTREKLEKARDLEEKKKEREEAANGSDQEAGSP